MKEVVVQKIPVCPVLPQCRVNALSTVWRGSDQVDVLDLLPVFFEAYHDTGCRDATSASHDEVFKVFRYILHLGCDSPKKDT